MNTIGRRIVVGAVHVGVLFFAGTSNDVLAQDASVEAVHMVDQACIEKKMMACAIGSVADWEAIAAPSAPACPTGYREITRGPWSNGQKVVCRLESLDVFVGSTISEDNRTRAIQRCRERIETFPSAFGESCMRKVETGRLMNAFEKDVKLLFRQLCIVSGNPKCEELDRLPAAGATAGPVATGTEPPSPVSRQKP